MCLTAKKQRTLFNSCQVHTIQDFPGGSDGKEFAYNAGDLCSVPGLVRFPGAELQYSCLENPHGQRCLEGYSAWGHEELDMTE